MKRNINREIRPYYGANFKYNYYVTSGGSVFGIDEYGKIVDVVKDADSSSVYLETYSTPILKSISDMLNEVGFTANYNDEEIVKESSVLPNVYVTNFGRCFTYDAVGRKYFYKLSMTDNGYIVISRYGNQYKVHDLIAKEFVPGYEQGKEVNHINRHRACNYYKNLEWVNHSTNCLKAKREIYE